MRHACTSSIAAVILALVPIAAAAQADVRRTPDGKPNLPGIWQVLNTAGRGGRGVWVGGELPYQPWALAKKQENFAARQTADPDMKGYTPGVPRIMYMPYPFKIFPQPG